MPSGEIIVNITEEEDDEEEELPKWVIPAAAGAVAAALILLVLIAVFVSDKTDGFYAHFIDALFEYSYFASTDGLCLHLLLSKQGI